MPRRSSSDRRPATSQEVKRDLEQLLSEYIHLIDSPREMIWRSFVRGVFGGLGGVVGATVMVALLVFLLQHFGGLPFIGHYFQTLGRSLKR